MAKKKGSPGAKAVAKLTAKQRVTVKGYKRKRSVTGHSRQWPKK